MPVGADGIAVAAEASCGLRASEPGARLSGPLGSNGLEPGCGVPTEATWAGGGVGVASGAGVGVAGPGVAASGVTAGGAAGVSGAVGWTEAAWPSSVQPT